MRTAKVTLEVTNAWEEWTVVIPEDLPDDEVEDYVVSNFGSLEAWMDESGGDHSTISNVDW